MENFKSILGLQNAISASEEEAIMADDISAVLKEIHGFGIDEVYFSSGEGKHYPSIFIKKVNTFDVQTLTDISETIRKVWNYQKVLFLYIFNEVEIRIYNCSEKPGSRTINGNVETQIKKNELDRANINDKTALSNILKVFSSVAVDSGTLWTLPKDDTIRKKLTFQRRVDNYLVDSMLEMTKQLKVLGLTNSAVTHKIILRSLFLLYLEDRKATDASFYSSFKPDARSYFDLLDDVECTYQLYDSLDSHFNGNIFYVDENEKDIVTKEHLKLIKECFTTGYERDGNMQLFPNWRIFDFSIIQIELLSKIYEQFLEEDIANKKKSGAYYTPPSLVKLILDEKLPVSRNYIAYNVKILDPACGSGIFLVESYKRLIERYENSTGNRLTDFDVLSELLVNNIFGVDINEQALLVAAFSLYLALLDRLDPKDIWQKKKLPCLINCPGKIPQNKQGYNLFCRDFIAENICRDKYFDIIVGNPPFGTENKSSGVILSETIREYCDEYGFAKEMVLPFLHKAAQVCPSGEIALIFNAKILTNTGTTYQNFRQWLFNDCYVEKIYNFSILRKAPRNFGGQLFSSAVGPICIAFYRKSQPVQAAARLLYYAPKTYIRFNLLEGVVIDSSDIKYLPREECQKPDSKIWKIAMWGTERDLNLINKLESSEYITIGEYASQHRIQSGVGFQLMTQATDSPHYSELIPSLQYLDADCITRYASPKDALQSITKSVKTPKAANFYLSYYHVKSLYGLPGIFHFRREGDVEAYKAPHIVVKKGLEGNKVCASFLEKDCTFRDGVYGFYGKDEEALKFLVTYLNSKLSTYYLFMTISSYGIEREQIMKHEYLSVPIVKSNPIREKEVVKLLDRYLESLHRRNWLGDAKFSWADDVDKILCELLGLDEDEIALINDCVDMNVDLYHCQEKSHALLPPDDYEVYTKEICDKMNSFLEDVGHFVNGMVYCIDKKSSLSIVKLTISETKSDIKTSPVQVNDELKRINQYLWEEKGGNIYFRKSLNYYDGDSIYVIRPNQRRFWTKSMAMEDASNLLLEILNKD